MNVAIVSELPAYPPDAGNRIRTLNLMLRLARRRHRITYICRGTGDARADRAAADFLADHRISTVIVDDPPPRRFGPAWCGRLAANLVSDVPYAVASHNSPAVRRAIRQHARTHDVDLWQFEWLAYADAPTGVSDAPVLLVAHNVETVIWRRFADTARTPLARWFMCRQATRFDRVERRAFAGADRVVTVSHTDAALVRAMGARDVAVVENGVGADHFAAADRGERDPSRVLFLGSLEWRPNLDAVELLLGHIMPRVRAEAPSARLVVVGRNPPASLVRQVARRPWAELHANVPDVRPFLATSGVMAVPLRVGSGSRLKILEALACGLPVVSTPVGVEGLELSAGRELLVADDPGALAAALVRCIRAPHEARQMAEAGRTLVLERYDWDVLADRMEMVWRSCCATPAVEVPA